MLGYQERFHGAGGLAGTGQRDHCSTVIDEIGVVVGELQTLHRFAGHPERGLECLPGGDHDGQRVSAADHHDSLDTGGEPVGDGAERRAVLPQCGLYRCRLVEQFGSGRLDADAQLGVQRIIARQGQDVGALGVGDPLHDGTLTGVQRAGIRIEKRTH